MMGGFAEKTHRCEEERRRHHKSEKQEELFGCIDQALKSRDAFLRCLA